MTPWQWWWIEEGEDEHGGWRGEHDTRAQAVNEAQRDLPGGTAFYVIEARSSEAIEHEGSECVPFLRTRNKERLVTGDAQPQSGRL